MHQGQARGFSGVPGWLLDMMSCSGAGVGCHISRPKSRNYVIIFVDTERSSDKLDIQGKNPGN